MWKGTSSAGYRKRIGKELGPGARTGQTQVSYGNIFSCDVTLVSTCNKKNLSFLLICSFSSFFFLSSFTQLQSLSFYSLTETAVLKRHGNLLFTGVPDLDRFRKNLILSHFLIQWVFKIMTPDLIIVFLNYWGFYQFASKMITIDKVPGKAQGGTTHLLCWVLLELPQPGSRRSPCSGVGGGDEYPSKATVTHKNCKQKTSLANSWHSLTFLLLEFIVNSHFCQRDSVDFPSR